MESDVFLSYNSADKPPIEVLARRLADEAGLKPFLDKWRLVPGEPWQEALEHALDASRTCAVFLGAMGSSECDVCLAEVTSRSRGGQGYG